MKYSVNVEHGYKRMSEYKVLTEFKKMFITPLFPKIHSVLKDKKSSRHVLWMQDLGAENAYTVSTQTGLRIDQLLKVVDSLAELQAFYMNKVQLERILKSEILIKADNPAIFKTINENLFFSRFLP
jgi:hypothetical protein